jgi:flagellar operon protein
MAIDRIQGGFGPANPQRPAGPNSAGGASFQDALRGAAQGVQFTNHAAKRLERRDLDLDPARLNRLNSAISRAAEKGSRNSVVMLDDLAVVVDIRDRKVITAINASQGKERVFTNIDSVVIA